MNKKIFIKFIAILLVCITVLNTTSTFAAFSLFNRSSSRTSSTINFISNLFNRNSSSKDKTTISSTPASSQTSVAQTQEFINSTVESILSQYQTKKTTGFISLLRNIFSIRQSQKIENSQEVFKNIFAKLFSNSLISNSLGVSSSDSERYATVFSDATKDITWTPETIRTAFNQLGKALSHCTQGIPTSSDKEEHQKLIDQYYTLDVNIYEKDELVINNFQELIKFANLPQTGYKKAEGKPIAITKATITGGNYGNGKEVTLVVLAGTGLEKGQAYGIFTDILCGMETNNLYLQYAVKAITENIAPGSEIVLAGFSLGGMMVQQVMIQPEILNNYKILNVVAGGAPALCVDERIEQFNKYPQHAPAKTAINRIIHDHDIVPFLCVDYLTNNIPTDIYETLHKEYDGYQYKLGFTGTHTIGYVKEELWKAYDALGYKGKNHTITLKLDDLKYYESPALLGNSEISILE